MSGVGYYEFFINGAHVSDRKLEPGYTHFDKRVLYSTYDVTSMLQHGETYWQPNWAMVGSIYNLYLYGNLKKLDGACVLV